MPKPRFGNVCTLSYLPNQDVFVKLHAVCVFYTSHNPHILKLVD